MNDILRLIAAAKRREVEAAKAAVSPQTMVRLARSVNRPTVSLRRSVLDHPGGIIAEFKRRSPSRGEIAPMADPALTVDIYTRAGAAACSILTDTRFFGGSLSDLYIARSVTSLPLLRKEFIIDSYQIHQARVGGADAILLIASLLSPETTVRFTDLAHELGMEVLLELHDPDELSPAVDNADLVGVNNRDLSTFVTDLGTSAGMIGMLPPESVKIAESGIKSHADLTRLKEAGFDGFLIGEGLMSAPDPAESLKNFIYGNV